MNLNELQGELERTLYLLRDRHPGLITWNECLNRSMRELNRLTGEAALSDPTAASPKRTKTFERWVLKDRDGNMIMPNGCEPYALMDGEIAKLGAQAHGLTFGKVRVTVEEIEG